MTDNKVTLDTLQDKKDKHEPITMITAYDYPTALLVDKSDVDMVLVGDSVGMVVHGFESTLPVDNGYDDNSLSSGTAWLKTGFFGG